MQLFFIRHGESQNNNEGRFTGQQDIPLTDLGREQARLIGRRILSEGLAPDVIISSPLIRALETAQLVADELHYPREAIIEQPLLMERFFGDIEGKSKAETGQLTDELIKKSGAESSEALIERAGEFLKSLELIEADRALVVSHNGFGKRLLTVLKGLNPEAAWELPDFPNAELVNIGPFPDEPTKRH
jgi:uncharacterized phosphatase